MLRLEIEGERLANSTLTSKSPPTRCTRLSLLLFVPISYAPALFGIACLLACLLARDAVAVAAPVRRTSRALISLSSALVHACASCRYSRFLDRQS